MNKLLLFFFTFSFFLVSGKAILASQPQGEPAILNFQQISIRNNDSIETVADYFPGRTERGIVLAPGAMFSKESWHFLAARFQEAGLDSLCLNSGAAADLHNALSFLENKGLEKITLVGASAGGAGVLLTLAESDLPLVDSVILLAPAGGVPVKNSRMKKLFIVAEDDMISSNAEVYRLYAGSDDPKLYEEITGSSDHAQRLFNGKYKEKIINMMIDFITE